MGATDLKVLGCFLHSQRKTQGHYKVFHAHFCSSQQKSISLNISYASILREYSQLKPLKQVHAQLITSGSAQNVFLSNRLLNSYASNGTMEVAEKVFRRMSHKNVVSWTIMVAAYTKNGFPSEALKVFDEMWLVGVLPNAVTVASVLPSCAMLGLIQKGRLIHSFYIQSGLKVNVYVETALVDLYAKCGSLHNARQVFNKMSDRNVVSWNTIISACSENGYGDQALQLFKQMQRNGVVADTITIISLLSACSSLGNLQQGILVHNHIIKLGFEHKSHIGTALMDMYVKCGAVQDAHQMFDEISHKDVVAWTIMISSLSEVGYGGKAVKLFNQMLVADVSLDSVALTGVLSICGRLGALQHGKCVHGLTTKTGFESYTFVGTALVDMYAKCGSLKTARSFFDRMIEKDVVSWNAMITANGINGCGVEAIDLFLRMKCLGMKPNDSTFIGVLSACSHAGLVDQGLQIFHSMAKELAVKPNLLHYACVVDLLGRAGRLHEACSLINNMPLRPDSNIYGALLGACRIHGDIDMGLAIAERLFKLEPSDIGFRVLVSNMYALAGIWDGVRRIRWLLRSKGLKKTPGYSLIEIDRVVHSFTSGDRDHPQWREIDDMVKSLISKIEETGYVPNTKSVFQDLPDDEKRDILYNHSEKLAIAFGILRTRPGTTIRVTKNLRTCNDCHTASKLISKVVGRVIVIRDSKRFHHFWDGVCSCGDYW